MLRVSRPELRLTSKGYHFDENGRKFVRIFTALDFVKIQVKIQPHKTMHVLVTTPYFPYTFTDNWIEIVMSCCDTNRIDEELKKIWFD